ncbi:hypothetical protein OH76DRAFT_1409775 [Lentinus brumalis]|uniref:Uncharacterized protein n=1 Tax=Lentinus brumalis TaxID=2498619 RepID=A0A371CU98_9APHY|nr:hypothetical protein OH76DRAFT_1409775 [Polyporus brumalis]
MASGSPHRMLLYGFAAICANGQLYPIVYPGQTTRVQRNVCRRSTNLREDRLSSDPNESNDLKIA